MTNKKVEFVQPEVINAGPFSAHREKKVREVGEREREREGGEDGGETIYEVGLVLDLVAVPHAVKEGFP